MAQGKKTGGRVAGTPNKATAEVKSLARMYGAQIIEHLYGLALGAENEAAQIAAAKELLDRGYGKATQMVGGDADNPIAVIQRIERVLVRPKA